MNAIIGMRPCADRSHAQAARLCIKIHDAGTSLLGVNDILIFKVEAGKLELDIAFNLDDVLSNVSRSAHKAAEKKLELLFDVARTYCRI
jgi:hypothetical protein